MGVRIAYFLNPICQLLGIANSGRKSHQLYLWRAINNRFFPNRTSIAIANVVTFIQNHCFYIIQRSSQLSDRSFVEHIAKNFGSHYHHICIGIDNNISRQQTNFLGIVRTKLILKIAKLLIRQSFEGSCIKHPLAMTQCSINCIFANQSFARTCRSADHYRFTCCQSSDRSLLKFV